MKKFEFPNKVVLVPEAGDEPEPKMHRPYETVPVPSHRSLTTLCKLAAKGEHIPMGGWDLSLSINGGFKLGELSTFAALNPTGPEGLFPKTNFTAYMAAEMLRRNPGLIISFEETPMQKLMASMEGYGNHG